MKFAVLSSDKKEITVTFGSEEETLKSLQGAAWLTLGEPKWDETDDLVGDRDSRNVKSILKAVSDYAFHGVYRITEIDGVEVHEYTRRKQGGMSECAAVLRSTKSPTGWARVDYVAGKRVVVDTITRHVKSILQNGQVQWNDVVDAGVPEAQATRHDLVSYLAKNPDVAMRIRIAPFHIPYLAVFLHQWLNEDREVAWDERVAHIGAAREKFQGKKAISELWNSPQGKEVVSEEAREPIMITTSDGGTVDLWSLPSGSYTLTWKGKQVSSQIWKGNTATKTDVASWMDIAASKNFAVVLK